VLYGSLLALAAGGASVASLPAGIIGLVALVTWVLVARSALPPLRILRRRGILGQRAGEA
jgi:hypothetical protein